MKLRGSGIPLERLGPNRFTISGAVRNNGVAQSSVTLTIDGKRYDAPLRSNDLPSATVNRIRELLPKGYRLLGQAQGWQPDAPVNVTIYKPAK